LTAGRLGSEWNETTVSNQAGVTQKTIQHWLSILAASYIAYILPPYYENIGKRLIKSPKIYFYDTGLACYLLGIENEKQLENHPLRGAIFENMIVNEAFKQIYNRGKLPNLFFYRDRSQYEVDLIQTKAQNLELFEIKSAKTFHKEFFKSIDYLKKIFGDRITRSTLIYDGKMETPMDEQGIINFLNLEI
jgi:predicted AAA+ superfamily ATPase